MKMMIIGIRIVDGVKFKNKGGEKSGHSFDSKINSYDYFNHRDN